MSEQVIIVNEIKDVVSATSTKLLAILQAIDPKITKIYFEYGHYTDIQERLAAYKAIGQNPYPLVALFEDFRIVHEKEGLTGVAGLKMIILYLSKNTLTREQREVQVFQPILYPIYKEILRQLKLNGNFNIYDETRIRHDQINRPHWGDPKLYDNGGYLFNDVLDGIELTNLQLETYLQITC